MKNNLTAVFDRISGTRALSQVRDNPPYLGKIFLGADQTTCLVDFQRNLAISNIVSLPPTLIQQISLTFCKRVALTSPEIIVKC